MWILELTFNHINTHLKNNQVFCLYITDGAVEHPCTWVTYMSLLEKCLFKHFICSKDRLYNLVLWIINFSYLFGKAIQCIICKYFLQIYKFLFHFTFICMHNFQGFPVQQAPKTTLGWGNSILQHELQRQSDWGCPFIVKQEQTYID